MTQHIIIHRCSVFHKENDTNNRENETEETIQPQNIINTKTKRRAKADSDTAIIQIKYKSYIDLLQTVKLTLEPNKVELEIKYMKHTRIGVFLLTVENGSGKTKVLKQELIE